MKVLFVISFVLGIGFWGTENSNFSYDSYVEDSATIEMLNVHFVKNIESEDLKLHLEKFMSNHLDQIDHITGHFAKESGMYYYTVYGSKDGQQKYDFLEVEKSKFNSTSYYDFEASASLFNLCRRGNGFPHPRICPGFVCQNWPQGGCLGLICPPSEC